MSYILDPGLTRDLTQARAALEVHGIVIMRGIENELEPAIMAEVKDSLSSSSKKLSALEDEELDRMLTGIRKTAMKSVRELRALYVRLLTRLGTGPFTELVDELDGIDQLFRWERVSKAVEPVNEALEKRGFRGIELAGPGDLSDGFQAELERWRPAFARFKKLAEQAAEQIRWQDEKASAAAKKKLARKG